MIAKFNVIPLNFEIKENSNFRELVYKVHSSSSFPPTQAYYTGFSYYMIFAKSAFNILMMKLVKVIININCLFHQIFFVQPYSSLEIFVKLVLFSFQDFRYALFLFSICLSDVYCKPLILQLIFYYSTLCFWYFHSKANRIFLC